MAFTKEELFFDSSDGKNKVYAEINMPEGTPRAVIAVSHGMIDHIGRYSRLIEDMTARGYIVAGNDHLGHGKTAASADDFGYFAKKDGYKLVIDDLKRMNGILRERFPNLPIFLLGHSMGSFISRLYAVKYGESIDALIIHGTAGPNPATGAGKLLVKLLRAIKGERYRSKFVCSLADGGYNKGFDPAEGDGAWLTRDPKMVADRVGNPKHDFVFTLAGYEDLFNFLGDCNSKDWFCKFPKGLKTLVISGEQDPVGGFGKGVRYVYDNLKKKGADVELKLYDGARHELFNETNREEVFADLIRWLGGVK